MPKLKPGTILVTDEEDRRIKEAIAADLDTSEMTDKQFAKLRPASELHPEIVEWYKKRTRGKQKKTPIYIRLDSDIVEHFKSSGKGWQTKINDALRKSMNSQYA
ncbi:BrnA antitoxin family protein [Candidatus Magnetomoraceae bacterium gMMP-1]